MPVQTRSHLYWYSFVCRWPMNPSDFFLQSVLPLERMFREGVFDKSIQYVPVLDGLQQPRYFQWWLSPFTRHEVTSALYEGVRTLCTTHTQLVQPLPTWRGHSLSPLHMYARVLAGRAAQYSEMRFAGGAPGRGLSDGPTWGGAASSAWCCATCGTSGTGLRGATGWTASAPILSPNRSACP